MTVTPDDAKAWLENQHHNRPIGAGLVRSLRQAIDDGRWEVTGQGISFDNEGRLVDGQHRLTAVVLSGKSVQMLCVHGVTREAALTAIDQGEKRTNAHVGTMLGEKNSQEKAAICRAIWVATSGVGLTDKFPPGTCWRDVMPAWRTEVERMVHGERNAPGFSAAVMGGLAMSLRLSRGEEFVSGAISGIQLDAGDPRLALRSSIGGAYGRSVRRANVMADNLLRVMAAADAFQNGERIAKLLISRIRYVRFCETARIPVSQPLMSYAEHHTG